MSVALDLDGTLVFPNQSGHASSDLVIPGRSRPTYMSRETADWLLELAKRSNLYLATARHARNVWGLVRQLPEVDFRGFVCEGGLVQYSSLREEAIRARPSRQALWLRECISARFPSWTLVDGYEQIVCCLGDVAPALARQSMGDLLEVARLEQAGLTDWQVHQERHKTFLYPHRPNKLAGLSRLGAGKLLCAAGDDSTYDLDMLRAAQIPVAPSTADLQVLQEARQRGYVSMRAAHAGAVDILRWACGELDRRAIS